MISAFYQLFLAPGLSERLEKYQIAGTADSAKPLADRALSG
jgi:hypothetical protein